MSPRDELLTTGRLGNTGALLLYDTVRLVGITRGFPPPDDHQSWDEDAVYAVAHDFLQSTRGPKRLLDIALRSVDDRSFERLLETAVVNHLRDAARKTNLGKLIVRIKDVLRSTPQFIQTATGVERWALGGARTEPSSATPAELATATVAIKVVTPRWTSATRNAPLADRDSMVRLIEAVLVAANGSLTPVDLAYALTARLDHRRVPLTIELDSADAVVAIRASGADPAARAASEIRATLIFDSLSDRERILVATLELNVRDLGALINVGKSQAAHLRQRLLDRVRGELEGDDEAEETASALARFCEDWLQQWTASTGATSNNYE
jgi:hypothetical protein